MYSGLGLRAQEFTSTWGPRSRRLGTKDLDIAYSVHAPEACTFRVVSKPQTLNPKP